MPSEFRPTLDENTVQNYKSLYEKDPSKFTDEQKALLTQHAEHYRIPFALNEKDNQGRIAGIMKQLGSGFLSGFSTFHVGDEPRDEWEGIARNVGHLAGFVGYIPAAPFKLLRLQKLAMAAQKLKGKSVPMLVAGAAQKKVDKIAGSVMEKAVGARGAATGSAAAFATSGVVKDIMRGAFHLGVASSVSSWQGGVDEMMRGFIGGAETGAVFRGIGNIVKTGSQLSDKILRGVASSAYTGLPSTLRGATTPEQVYEYLLGAYFGVKEMPYHRREAMGHLRKMHKSGEIEPEVVPGWEKLDKLSQETTKEESKKIFGDVDEAGVVAFKLAKKLGIPVEEAQKLAEEFIKKRPRYNEFGESLADLPEKPEKTLMDEVIGKGRESEESESHDKDNSDVGTPLAPQMPVTTRMQNWVEKSLKNLHDSKPSKIAKISYEMESMWHSLVKNAKETDNKNPSDVMTDWIESKYGTSLGVTQKNFWRQWGETRLKGRRVPMWTVTNGKLERIVKGNDLNKAGQRKVLIEEPKLIDEVYNKALEEKEGPKTGDPKNAYEILDNVVEITDKGYREFSLIDAHEYYLREARKKWKGSGEEEWAKIARTEADNKMEELHAKNFYEMDKNGMYYYGGKGDANRQYFVRYHPKTATSKNFVEQQLNEIKRIFTFNGVTKAEFKKSFEEDMGEWTNQMVREGIPKGKVEEMFKRAYISNIFYELEMNGFKGDLNGLSTTLKKGFINNAKAFNKRQQIWFTSGFSSDPDFIRGRISDLHKDGGWNVRYVNDLKDDGKINKELWSDGAVYGRSDAIDALNAGWGISGEGGANKSFIVSPDPQKGAVLGKYMIHTASEKLENYMKKNNIHFLIPETAAKQLGTRKLDSIMYGRGKVAVTGENSNLPIEHMKGVFSEITDSHYILPQRLPKQMSTNLTPFAYKNIETDVIEDMYNTLSRNSFEGSPEWNTQMDTYLSNPKANKNLIPDLLKHLDEISVSKVLDAIKTNDATEFANKAYMQIQKVNKNLIHEMMSEGEMSESELRDSDSEINDMLTASERIMRYSGDSLAGMLHKFNRDYRMSTVRNYVVNRLTKPRVENSFSSRMRPYDVGLQFRRNKYGNTSLLKKRKDIFFLDDGYKDMKIKSSMWDGYRTLGDVWTEYVDGGFKGNRPRVKELLRTTLVRVPMDSLSGAHALEFKGFTGVRGFGSLIHAETMEALGGADLDGDKAFGFFGSEKYGFKKKWKDMYADQRDEHKNESAKHLKDEFRKELAETDEEFTDRLKGSSGRVLQYSPQVRRRISDGAAIGRGMLGPAVVNRAVINAAYASARGSKKGFYEYEHNFGTEEQPDNLIIRMQPRKDEKSMTRFRRLARASVAFASDPMDEAGLRSRNTFFTKLIDSAFSWELFEPPTKLGGKKKYLKNLSLQFNGKRGYNDRAFEKRLGLTRFFSEVNSALYGRNLSEGRRWSFNEIKDRIDNAMSSDGLPPESRNTLLPKIAKDLQGIDWSDNIFQRINMERLTELYDLHNKNLGAFAWLKKAIGRDTMGVPRGHYIDLVLNNKLWTSTGMEKLVNAEEDPFLWKGNKKDNPWKTYTEKKGYNPKDLELRKRNLMDLLRKAEDYIVNDLSDIASINRIVDVASGMKPAEILDIIGKADNLKESSYLMARRRGTVMDLDVEGISKKAREQAEWVHNELEESPFSALGDRIQIDRSISEMKKDMTPQQSDLLDAFLLGSIHKGKHDKVKEIEKKVIQLRYKNTDKRDVRFYNRLLHRIKKKLNNTSISRLGFNSRAVSENSIKAYMEEYNKLFDMSTRVVPKAERDRVQAEAKVSDKPQALFDEDGNRMKGTTIEVSDYDEATQKYLDDHAPFTGLHDGKLKGEAKEIYSELKEHLDYYHDGIGRNLNGLVRGMLGKELNTMHLEDFRTLNRMFKQMRTGTWWQQFFNKVKSGSPKLTWWHYNMFPEAINRDLLRYEMHLMDDIRPFKDKFGNVVSGKAHKPVSVMEDAQTWIHSAQEQSIQAHEEEKKNLRFELDPLLKSIEDGDVLHAIAIRQREMGIIDKHLKPTHGKSPKILELYSKEYRKRLEEVEKKSNWTELRNKKHMVTTTEGIKQMTSEEVVKEINNVYTKWNKKVHSWMKGDPEYLKKYIPDPEDWSLSSLYELRLKFIKDVKATMTKGERFPIDKIGIDGLRQISKRIMISQIPKAFRDEIPQIKSNIKIEETGQFDFESYFPHMLFDKKVAGKALKDALDVVMKDKTISKEDKEKEVKTLAYHYKRLTGDWIPTDEFGEGWDALNRVYSDISSKKKDKKNISWFHANQKVGNQFSRSSHIAGWNVEPEVYENYMKNVLDTYYRLVSQVGARTAIIDFRFDHLKRYNDPDMTNSWSNFLNLYAQQAMGYPSNIPNQVLENPNMKLKGTPYKWFADSQVLKKLNSITKKLGIKGDVKLPEEMRGIDQGQLTAFGNLEAKYELATLLAHPKSSIANLYGGSAHTLISTGYDNMRNARKFGYLKTHINPEWESMKDVEEWVRGHGVIEQFLMYEADINPKLKNKKWKVFMKDAVDKLKREPDMEDKSLYQLAKQHGITESMFNKAAWFMRRPERTLRRDAFVAHYLQAKEKWGGAFKDMNHPYLIEMAKKGVKGTQFLYSAPFRPMFAGTTMGKVMTRFQLWAWNAVRFRNQVIREAEVHGWKEGTIEFDRFKRLATADLMMLSLASVFMYSLFENALPAPWNWFQDTADMMFGDDKDRERAFFGAYPAPLQPLQMVTPPALRLLPPLFKGVVQDDYSKLSNYYIWTMFPFGRFARDVIGKGGMLENPFRGVEKMTGLPYMQFAKQFQAEKEKEKKRPRGLI